MLVFKPYPDEIDTGRQMTDIRSAGRVQVFQRISSQIYHLNVLNFYFGNCLQFGIWNFPRVGFGKQLNPS